MLSDSNDGDFVIKDYAKEERDKNSYSNNPSSTKRQDPGKVMRNSSSNIPK
jgi:hypothetical protein